jgi:hypothetical protein
MPCALSAAARMRSTFALCMVTPTASGLHAPPLPLTLTSPHLLPSTISHPFPHPHTPSSQPHPQPIPVSRSPPAALFLAPGDPPRESTQGIPPGESLTLSASEGWTYTKVFVRRWGAGEAVLVRCWGGAGGPRHCWRVARACNIGLLMVISKGSCVSEGEAVQSCTH